MVLAGTPIVRVRPLGRRVRALVMGMTVTLLSACGRDDTPSTADTVVTSIAGGTADSLATATTAVVDGIPDAIPASAVPDGATTSGIVASNGVTGSSVVEFTLSGDVDREALSAASRAAIEAEGWVFVERSYDATTMRMIFTATDEASSLTWVLVTGDGPPTGSITVVGS